MLGFMSNMQKCNSVSDALASSQQQAVTWGESVMYRMHVALPFGCSVPMAELLYLSAVGIAQLVAHETGKSNLCEG